MLSPGSILCWFSRKLLRLSLLYKAFGISIVLGIDRNIFRLDMDGLKFEIRSLTKFSLSVSDAFVSVANNETKRWLSVSKATSTIWFSNITILQTAFSWGFHDASRAS